MKELNFSTIISRPLCVVQGNRNFKLSRSIIENKVVTRSPELEQDHNFIRHWTNFNRRLKNIESMYLKYCSEIQLNSKVFAMTSSENRFRFENMINANTQNIISAIDLDGCGFIIYSKYTILKNKI